MKTTTIICSWCGLKTEKPAGEIKRRKKAGKVDFFCNLSCSALWGNEKSGLKSVEIEKKCPCGVKFISRTKVRSSNHCSRECASKFSVTEKRLGGSRKGGINSPHTAAQTQAILKIREAWKYSDAEAYLNKMKTSHEFEFLIDSFIYDLAIFDLMIIVEFDGREHDSPLQKKTDKEKDKLAKKNGWKVIRIPAKPNTVINPRCLYEII